MTEVQRVNVLKKKKLRSVPGAVRRVFEQR